MSGVISDALNSVYALLRENNNNLNSHIESSEKRYTQLDTKIDKVYSELSDLNTVVAGHERTLKSLESSKATREQFQNLNSKVDTVKAGLESSLSDVRSTQEDFRSMLDQQQKILENFELNIKRIERVDRDQNERLNVQEIRNRHLYVTIEGFPEAKVKSVAGAIVKQVNEDASAKMQEQDFVNAYRVGKFNAKIHKKNPRQIRVKMKDDTVRDNLLACRGKL